MKQKILMMVIGLLIWQPASLLAQVPKKFSTYAQSDFAEYQKSGAANAAWDDFVKEGFNALDKEDAQSAVEMLRKAANLGCASPLVSFKLAIGYESMGAYYSAVQYYELARDQFKKMNANHRYTLNFDNNYARALYSMGQVEKAKSIIIKTCNESCDPWALKLLAGQSLAQKDLTRASGYIEKLLGHPESGLSPDDKKELTLNLARIYASNGDNDTAGKYYKQLQELDPNNSEPDQFFKKPAKAKSIPHDASWNEYDKIFDMLDNR